MTIFQNILIKFNIKKPKKLKTEKQERKREFTRTYLLVLICTS